MMNLSDVKDKLREFKANEKLLGKQISEKSAQISDNKIRAERITKANWLLVEAAKATQNSVKEYLEITTTKLIRAAYDDRPFKFLVEYETKRNRSNCFLRVQEGDNEPSVPKEDDGGGMVEIISTALRCEMWGLERPRSRNVIFLDEPMESLGNRIGPAIQMLRNIATEAKIQLVIITHNTEFLRIADRSWTVVHNGHHSVAVQNNVEPEMEISEPVKSRRRIRARAGLPV